MCAIFGILGPYDPRLAERAFATLAHRGPDHSAFLARPGLFLGHHRLSIIDPLPEADQPMRVAGVTILFNGEIYNYRQLRRTLGGPFATRSDTEVLARAYLRWGDEMAGRLRGMYAAAFYDGRGVDLIRDPFGKKPLYYALVGESFVFASEIRAILTLFPHIRWQKEAITAYLSYQTLPAPHTLFPPIRQLEPGGRLRYEGGTIRLHTPEPLPRPAGKPLPAPEEIAASLQEAVALRLVADTPVGALLSGGVDSSFVATLAARLSPQPLPTFTVGYEGHDKYDERPYARLVAESIGSDHHEAVMGPKAFLQSAKELAAHLDEPLGDPAAVPLWFLSRQVKKAGLKVLLTGDGADELFFGYRFYYEILDIEKARELKYRNWLRNYFRAHYSPNKEWEWYKRVFEGSILFRSSAELFTDLQQNRLLRQNVKDNTSLAPLAPYAKRFGDPYGPGWMSYIDLKIQLGDLFLKKLDRVTMAHGIEARSPFLDRSFASGVLQTDPTARMGSAPKWLLKEAAAPWLPPRILARRKKGFSYPFMEWILESGEIERLRRFNARARLFRPEALDFLIGRARRGRFRHHLYALWFLALWLECREGEICYH